MRRQPGTSSIRSWLISATLVLVLSACGSAGTDDALPEYDATPSAIETPAAEAARDDLRLPLQVRDATIVDPGWQTPPQYANDVFLSADHTQEVLTFRAVDSTGSILWEADRPLSCTGFTLTTNQDTSYAVLTDIDAAEDRLSQTTASAYDLHTSEHAWGPVTVPGPHHGPGTVFAAPTEQAMGQSGPKVVLNPASGEVLVDEREHDVSVLGEFHGTVLLVVNDAIQAYSATELADAGLEADALWTLDPTDFGWDIHDVSARLPVGLTDPTGSTASVAVLVGTDDTDRALVNLTDGHVLEENLAEAAQDPTSQTWVTVGDTMTGYSASGEVLYNEPHDDLSFHGVGAAMAYFENPDGDLAAHNVVTGKLGRAYDPEDTGTLAIPSVITANGAAVLEAEGTYYLATLPAVEQPEDS